MLCLRIRAWSETLSQVASAAKEVLVNLPATRWSCGLHGSREHKLGLRPPRDAFLLKKDRYEKEYWPSRARKDAKYQGTALICKGCRDRGCTARDLALYTCTTCSRMFGAAKMDAVCVRNLRVRPRCKLTCSSCVAAQKECMRCRSNFARARESAHVTARFTKRAAR